MDADARKMAEAAQREHSKELVETKKPAGLIAPTRPRPARGLREDVAGAQVGAAAEVAEALSGGERL